MALQTLEIAGFLHLHPILFHQYVCFTSASSLTASLLDGLFEISILEIRKTSSCTGMIFDKIVKVPCLYCITYFLTKVIGKTRTDY